MLPLCYNSIKGIDVVRKSIDYTGVRFGRLMALERARTRTDRAGWLCRCECGNEKIVATGGLKSGGTKSCGCLEKEVRLERNRKDITNKRFGRLLAINCSGKDNHNNFKWLCLCDCGRETNVTVACLMKGTTKSCGCLQKEKASENTSKDLTGLKVGRLTVIKEYDVKELASGSKRRRWLCKCECGNEKVIITSALTSKKTKSCGCIQSEMMVERMSGENHYNYNAELTTEERTKHRYKLGGFNATKWRTGVFLKDNYTCQVCKARNGLGKNVYLEAHHLDGWNWCINKRYDLDNGITLCFGCHRYFHKIYGGGNNTKEQFEEYSNEALK